MKTVSDMLKKAVAESGLSFLEIERRSDVNRLSISRFMRGMTGLSLEQADMLAEFFGLVLVPEERVMPSGKGGKKR